MDCDRVGLLPSRGAAVRTVQGGATLVVPFFVSQRSALNPLEPSVTRDHPARTAAILKKRSTRSDAAGLRRIALRAI